MTNVTFVCYRNVSRGHANRKHSVVTFVALGGQFIKYTAYMTGLTINESVRTIEGKAGSDMIKGVRILKIIIDDGGCKNSGMGNQKQKHGHERQRFSDAKTRFMPGMRCDKTCRHLQASRPPNRPSELKVFGFFNANTALAN